MLSDRAAGRWCLAWSVALAVLLLGPALGAGAVLSYDMVWVPDLAVTRDVLGLGSGLPRAVPSDAVVAVLDEVVPGLVLQRIVLLGALVAGGLGAARLVSGRLLVRLAAIGLYQWNAYVVERLLIGHWPVLVGYALLPWVLVAARRWRDEGRLPPVLLVLLPLGSLSASAGLATAVVALAAAAGRGRTRVLVVVLAAANAPWLMAGALHASSATTDPVGAELFALHGEGGVPGPLAALTLGGIWNAEVVPDSRAGVAGWVSLLVLGGLAALGARRWWHDSAARERTALLACWGVGWGIATASWLLPGALGWLGAHLPGGGVLRDGARMLALCAPLLVVLVASGIGVLVDRLARTRAALAATGLTALLLPVVLLPDAAWGSADRLAPATYPTAWGQARTALHAADPDGLLLVLPLSAFRRPSWNGQRTTFDPLGRYLGRPYVASDVLPVSGTAIPGEDPLVPAAAQALAADGPEARARRLLDLGIGAVVVDHSAPGAADVPAVAGDAVIDGPELSVTVLPGRPDPRPVATTDRLAMAVAWTAYAGLLSVAAAGLLRRRARERAPAPPP
ncbi:hypothetical protein [Nocardioides nitrophenolicus]|uniref:hypothetical protein n=1 Tax=Nocardioides nitrophenolicus TaxID=60489 RepID=UPI00195EA93A|nr:hypothetical protein [Nocardioides nitrophenolicus]MBM7515263.1 uncharacterized membrane protein YhaH (DUF805 family) [Nocardioides nitrophenolicus]